ncbi:hypothetical protein GGR56DRAFT_354649 [Xylariaceae sp. FL0804]|nr:hypothetical protein GGR56DRAFT_354649 [Xylariaceae sp. FL0804]
MAPHAFHLDAATQHLRWSRAIPPVLTVPSGAELDLELPDGGGNQVARDTADLRAVDLARADPGVGPVYVEGAEPGDGELSILSGNLCFFFSFFFSPCSPLPNLSLNQRGLQRNLVVRVEFLSLEPAADFGWTGVFPGFGLLSDDFDGDGDGDDSAGLLLADAARLRIWDLRGAPERGYLVFREKKKKKADGDGGPVEEEEIRVPYRPFLGLVGVAPGEGEHSMIPPLATGGNIDTRWAGVGSTLYLPVQVPGALLSCGDGHAAQGDGEVCGTAIEMRTRARIRVTVEKAASASKPWVQSPWILTAPPGPGPGQEGSKGDGVGSGSGGSGGGGSGSGGSGGREFMCLGIDSDIREATRKAVRGVVDWLSAEKRLSRIEAYMLASVAGHLRMCEVVDMPNYAIGCAVPLDIFVS